jgi:hypothetical protein
MRRASVIAVLATIGAAALVLAGASAAAGPRAGQPASTKNHVGAAAGPALVTQVGPRNYAGPNCPGVSWNCTKSTRVLQIATAGGQNVAVCTEATCSFDQSEASNQAACIQRTNLQPVAVQSCEITQHGARNRAVVYQSIDQKNGTDETATQSAMVEQGPAIPDGTTAINDSQIVQLVRQKAGPGDDDDDDDNDDDAADALTAPAAAQNQDAHQSAVVTQSASEAGKNTSQISQSQHQKARHALIQNQNATEDFSANCASGIPFAPNTCARVSQSLGSGKNTSDLDQSVNQNAHAHGAANQQQGSTDGGIEASVHQAIDGASGNSTNRAKQSKRQKMKAASGSQQQYDPLRCCGTASQFGGTGNTEKINQYADLDASGRGGLNQSADLLGQSVSPMGSCAVSHHVSINADRSDRSFTVRPPCVALIVETSCRGFAGEGEGGDCTEVPAIMCTDAEQEGCGPCDIDPQQCDRLSLVRPGLNTLSARPRN